MSAGNTSIEPSRSRQPMARANGKATTGFAVDKAASRADANQALTDSSPGKPATGLDAVKAATRTLHAKAERGGIIACILAGSASRMGVAHLLRNLLPVYQALDSSSCGVPALARSAAIEADLVVLSPGVALPLLPEGRAYAERVKWAAQGDGARLIAHAYVRYLGDLNGGQIMKRRLIACLGDSARTLAVHDYPMLEDAVAFAREYRNVLDRAVDAAGLDVVVQEAIVAFEMNIALSEAIGAGGHLLSHPPGA